MLSVGTLGLQLAHDELFGHVDGAFTGARRPRAGLIASAGVGTLLLDDIQTLDLGVQSMLYQVLDRYTYKALGSDRTASAVCRVILAMKEHPDTLMKLGVLVEDLRYRFGACSIRMPPLRERRDEIPVHAQRALESCPAIVPGGGGPTRFRKSAIAMLCEAEYKGNIRQLISIVECAYLLGRAAGRDEIWPQDLDIELPTTLRYRRHGKREANCTVVERMLAVTDGNVTEAAERLGVSRATVVALRARMRRG